MQFIGLLLTVIFYHNVFINVSPIITELCSFCRCVNICHLLSCNTQTCQMVVGVYSSMFSMDIITATHNLVFSSASYRLLYSSEGVIIMWAGMLAVEGKPT